MRRTRNFVTLSKNFEIFWKLNLIFLATSFPVNCVLSYYTLLGMTLAIKGFTICVCLTSLVYLIESLCTRGKNVEFFNKIVAIDMILKPSKGEQVVQLSKENIIKIIFVLMLFVVQLVMLSVKHFIYSTFDRNV